MAHHLSRQLLVPALLLLLAGCGFVEAIDKVESTVSSIRDTVATFDGWMTSIQGYVAEIREASKDWDTDKSGDLSWTEAIIGLFSLLGIGGASWAGRRTRDVEALASEGLRIANDRISRRQRISESP